MSELFYVYSKGTHIKYSYNEIQEIIDQVNVMRTEVLRSPVPSPPKQVISVVNNRMEHLKKNTILLESLATKWFMI